MKLQGLEIYNEGDRPMKALLNVFHDDVSQFIKTLFLTIILGMAMGALAAEIAQVLK